MSDNDDEFVLQVSRSGEELFYLRKGTGLRRTAMCFLNFVKSLESTGIKKLSEFAQDLRRELIADICIMQLVAEKTAIVLPEANFISIPRFFLMRIRNKSRREILETNKSMPYSVRQVPSIFLFNIDLITQLALAKIYAYLATLGNNRIAANCLDCWTVVNPVLKNYRKARELSMQNELGEGLQNKLALIWELRAANRDAIQDELDALSQSL